MKRRELIRASAAFAAAATPLLGRAAQPCPPPVVSAAGGTTATTACTAASATTYSSSFDTPESRLSEGGRWRQADPINQTFVQIVGGRAFGTLAASASPPPYRDSNAYATGFGNNHEVEGVIYRNPAAPGSPNREVAILLRCFEGNSRLTAWGTSAAHYYYFSWSHIGAYLILNDFLSPAELKRAPSCPAPVSGDRFRGRIEGRRLRCWVNDVLQIDHTDNNPDYSVSNPTAAGYHPTGNPGIGFYCDNGASVTDFGFDSVTIRAL